MQSQTRDSSVVLYPSPGMGHLVSMFELGKLLVRRHNLSVTILIIEPDHHHHHNSSSTSLFINAAASASSSNPSISFHRLPSLTPPPNPSPHHEAVTLDLLRLSNPNVLSFLAESSPSALIIDFFCAYALDASTELNIPTYIFFTSGANYLSLYLRLPEIHDSTSISFCEMGITKVDVPGNPPIPADHVPLPLLDRDDEAYKGFLYGARRISTESTGIIINTFDALEKRAIDACSINGNGKFPPLHCIGPLIAERGGDEGPSKCLSWLDEQPRRSVVFLCFGSLGVFQAPQIKEIAVGLENSEQRFLWAIRPIPLAAEPEDGRAGGRAGGLPEPGLDKLLPEGFLGRTEGRGMVVESWAPQAAVLKHESVGGFVTHCGWNSSLEAICGGVPMIGWPLYAEQHMNLVYMVGEMRLGVEMKGYNEELVNAEEVEAKVRWLMLSAGGKELRDRAAKAKEAATAAVEEGGSSYAALTQLVKPWS